MTKREMFEAVINGTINEEVIAIAQAEIERLDNVNAKRRENAAVKAAEKRAEKEPIRQAVMAVMTAEPKTASTLIAEAGVEIKPQAIPSLLKGLVEDGTLEKVDVKVKGKGTQKGYKLA